MTYQEIQEGQTVMVSAPQVTPEPFEATVVNVMVTRQHITVMHNAYQLPLTVEPEQLTLVPREEYVQCLKFDLRSNLTKPDSMSTQNF